MDETLKPCPFCGGSWVVTHRPANGSQPHISCKECNASGPLTAGMTEAQWRAAWNTRADTAPTPKADEVKAVARAIKSASCPGREGPFGGYDYGYNEAFYGPAPEGGRYVIRDFRDPSSPDWGAWLHQTNDRDEHESMFAKMTDDHVALAAIAALDIVRRDRVAQLELAIAKARQQLWEQREKADDTLRIALEQGEPFNG